MLYGTGYCNRIFYLLEYTNVAERNLCDKILVRSKLFVNTN